MALTFTNPTFAHRQASGSWFEIILDVNLDTSYPSGGYSIAPSKVGLKTIYGVDILGYKGAGSLISDVEWSYSTGKLVARRVATSTPAGSISAPVFTGTIPLNDLDLANPAFSGTGLTAAGQVITTTDNQTMTLNQCAGMWLISATGATPPNLILSNTAVAGAPAVLTVQGSANTDAGAYKIVRPLAPVGTNSAPTFTGTALGQIALAEVSAGVNLSAITVRMKFLGI